MTIKKILMLCIGLLFMVACEKDQDQHEIVVEQTKYTLDDQGKATISCKVTPEDFDISNLKMGYHQVVKTIDDPSLPGVDIISVTKDAQTPGKWSVVIGLTGVDGKPYTPKPRYNYEIDATVDFYALKTSGEPIHTTKFQFSLDVKSTPDNGV